MNAMMKTADAMITIKDTITKPELANMPKVAFKGNIYTICSEGEIKKVFQALKHYKIVGIDTETRPSFKKGKMNKVALLQIATDDICWLIRLNMTGVTNEIKEFLEDKEIKKIGISLRDDFRQLNSCRSIAPQSYIELQQYAENFGIKDKSLQKIYGILFDEKISKSQRLTNWESDELTDSQKTYAATDAWACLKIYERFKAMEGNGYELIHNGTDEENVQTQTSI